MAPLEDEELLVDEEPLLDDAPLVLEDEAPELDVRVPLDVAPPELLLAEDGAAQSPLQIVRSPAPVMALQPAPIAKATSPKGVHAATREHRLKSR